MEERSFIPLVSERDKPFRKRKVNMKNKKKKERAPLIIISSRKVTPPVRPRRIRFVCTSKQHSERNSPCGKREVTVGSRKSLRKKTKKTAPMIIFPSTDTQPPQKPPQKLEAKKSQVVRVYFQTFVIVTKETTMIYPRGSFWDGEEELGAGSYGTVYLVRTHKNQDAASSFPPRMANKTAPLEKSETLRYERRILSECVTGCPYVIKCYGHEITEGRSASGKIYNLFLEYCSGGTLCRRIINSGLGMLESEVKQYTRDILRGLSYIHANKIVHLDIKPDNILLMPRSDGEDCYSAKISDFGLCKNLRIEAEKSRVPRGTSRFMSPEVVNDRILSYPADIWAVGCSVVEMMTALPVWDDDSANTFDGIMRLINDERIQRPGIPSNMSEEGKDFLNKCFIRNYQRRWTAEMLLQHPFLKF